MISKEEMKKRYGVVMFEGEGYIATQDAYPDGLSDDPDAWVYKASAIKATDTPDEYGDFDTYVIIWDIYEEYRKPYEEGDTVVEEDMMCDWENPADVYKY